MQSCTAIYTLFLNIGKTCERIAALRHVKVATAAFSAFKSLYKFFSGLLNDTKNFSKNTYEKIKITLTPSKKKVEEPETPGKIEKLRNLAHGFFSLQLFKLAPLLPAAFIPSHLIRFLFVVDIAAIFGSYYHAKADKHEIVQAKDKVHQIMHASNFIGSIIMVASSVLHLLQLVITASTALTLVKTTAFYLSVGAYPLFAVSLGLYLWINREWVAQKFKSLAQKITG